MTTAFDVHPVETPSPESVFTLLPQDQLTDLEGQRIFSITFCDGASRQLQMQHLMELARASLPSTRVGAIQSMVASRTPLILSVYFDPLTKPDSLAAAASNNEVTDSDNAVIERRVAELLFEARELHFEDGVDTPFSIGLIKLVRQYGQVVLQVIIGYWRLLAKMYVEEFCEIVIQLGRLHHEPTKEARRTLIESALSHSDPGVRDAATLGLDALSDPQSRPALLHAREEEEVPSIKRMLDAMLQAEPFSSS